MQIQDSQAITRRRNGHDSVSNHQPHDCLLNRLFRRRSKKTSKLRVTGVWAGNSPGTGEFRAQTSNAENVSIWWRHHAEPTIFMLNLQYSLQQYPILLTPYWFQLMNITSKPTVLHIMYNRREKTIPQIAKILLSDIYIIVSYDACDSILLLMMW